MDSFEPAKKCGIQRGFFVLRECGKPAKAVCPSCKRDVCSEHRREYGGKKLCIECAVRKRRADEWPDDHDPTTSSPSLSTYYYSFGTSSSPSSNDDSFSGGGGTFGGGGAAGSWAASDSAYAFRDQFYENTAHDPGTFSPADFAAFDAAGDDFDDNDTGADFFDS